MMNDDLISRQAALDSIKTILIPSGMMEAALSKG